ncbi:sugar phosphate isomerase/epimerase family protein [Salimicrobium halophilum]|uniref:Sugar phosphate isomerase/epimerase n=1 Tax=Salimicrobium halophilum TaxID=86666 RepID=A0A1G8R160_9BACI|nr:sugar phosphate isomerase/epimerase [Salimicrobium halophilum]SDJ10593.1 Sugar phosphate isomerase/epimerase [Salimicrobium halophilum]
MNIGLQLFSVRNELERNPFETLKKVAEIGYTYVELPIDWMNRKPASEWKRMLEESGLSLWAVHLRLMDGMEPEEVKKYMEELGCTRLVHPIEFFETEKDVSSFIKKMNDWTRSLPDMDLYYHNHFHEFQEIGGKRVLDRLMEETSWKLELDTYWAARGGSWPTEALQQYGGKVEMLHQKDMPHLEPVNIFEEIGGDAVVSMDTLENYGKAGNFTEIGQGTMDIPGILEATAAEIVFVEQDATVKEELDSVEESFHAIKRMTP